MATPLKTRGSPALRAGGESDKRVLTALFLGVCVGALAAMMTKHPLPSPGSQPLQCPSCPACDAPSFKTLDETRLGGRASLASATIASATDDGATMRGSGPPASCPGAFWTPATSPAALDPAGVARDEHLAALLAEIAKGDEVLVAVSNKALITPDGRNGMLRTWIDAVRDAGVTNALVVALDEHTRDAMDRIGFPRWHREPRRLSSAADDNHGVSAQKFHILREFLILGYGVLLSDVDVATIANPFDHLVRDADVEGMSDGFDARTAYGWNDGVDDPKMGWARYAQTMRIYAMNSGLFYVRPSERSVALMDKITSRLEREKAWDQAVYNEAMFFPSRPARIGIGGRPGSSAAEREDPWAHVHPGVTTRVMDHEVFVNSKTLFVRARHDGSLARMTPAMVHVNYHPDKWERMKAALRYFVGGDKNALSGFPDGSCANAPDCR